MLVVAWAMRIFAIPPRCQVDWAEVAAKAGVTGAATATATTANVASQRAPFETAVLRPKRVQEIANV